MQKARKIPGRIPSITQKLEDRDALLKRSLGRSQSKRTAPGLPQTKTYENASWSKGDIPARPERPVRTQPSALPKMKSYDTDKPDDITNRYNDYHIYYKSQGGDTSNQHGGTIQDGRHQQQTKGVTRNESTRDTTLPSHYNRPRPKPSFRNVRPKKPVQEQELQMLPTRIPNATDSPSQMPISSGADVHASGHRSSFI